MGAIVVDVNEFWAQEETVGEFASFSMKVV